MNEQIIMVGILSCASCWIGYAFGYWMARRNSKMIIKTLSDMSRKKKNLRLEICPRNQY